MGVYGKLVISCQQHTVLEIMYCCFDKQTSSLKADIALPIRKQKRYWQTYLKWRCFDRQLRRMF